MNEPGHESRAERRAKKGRNRNAERSVRLLESAFVNLLADKPYEKITVTDVTSAAGLNRGTFYAHYVSMSDLRDQVFQKIVDRLSHLIDLVTVDSFVENPLPTLTEIGSYLVENRELMQKLIGSKTLEPFLNSMRESLRAHIHSTIAEDGSSTPVTPLVADYISAGVLGVYRSWIMGDYGSETVDDVNRDLCELISRAVPTSAPAPTAAA